MSEDVVRLTAYACMSGHVVYCEESMAGYICSFCLGRVKNLNISDLMILSVVQGSVIEDEA